MALVIEVLCEGNTHRLEFRDDGTIRMLDHDGHIVREASANKQERIECLDVLDKATANPVVFIFDRVKVDRDVVGFLSCEFVEHVLPIWESKYPHDIRLRQAIHSAKQYLKDKNSSNNLNTEWSAVSSESIEAAEAESEAWSNGAAMRWTDDSTAEWSVSRAVRWTIWSIAEAWTERVVVRTAQAAADAVSASTYYASSCRKNQVSAREDEKMWQAARIVQVIEAIQRGKNPWA